MSYLKNYLFKHLNNFYVEKVKNNFGLQSIEMYYLTNNQHITFLCVLTSVHYVF